MTDEQLDSLIQQFRGIRLSPEQKERLVKTAIVPLLGWPLPGCAPGSIPNGKTVAGSVRAWSCKHADQPFDLLVSIDTDKSAPGLMKITIGKESAWVETDNFQRLVEGF